MADQNEEFDLVVLGDKISQVVESYWKPFLGVVVVGVGIAGVSVAMKKSASNEQKSAFEKLYAITEPYDKKKKDFEKAELPPKPPEEVGKDGETSKEVAEKEPEEIFEKASGDIEKDYGETVKRLEAFIAQNPQKQATGEAALTLSSIYQEYDKNQQAVDVVLGALKDWPQKDLMFSLLNMKAGNLLSELGDCAKALSHWTLLTQTESFAKDEAILKVGLCHQKLGQTGEAKVWFQKISSKVPETPSATSAKKFLRYLQFQEKLPPNASDQNTKPNQDSAS